jgi:CRP/FNR family transcriptional regulator
MQTLAMFAGNSRDRASREIQLTVLPILAQEQIMSNVVAYPVASPAFVPLHASPSSVHVPATARAPRNDALRYTACSMRSICMPQGLTPEECKRMEALICLSRTIKQGETIYRTNDSFQSIYVVGAGSCKTVLMRDRRER